VYPEIRYQVSGTAYIIKPHAESVRLHDSNSEAAGSLHSPPPSTRVHPSLDEAGMKIEHIRSRGTDRGIEKIDIHI
jgi:hypothetical protein